MRKALPVVLLIVAAFGGLGIYFARKTPTSAPVPAVEQPAARTRPHDSLSETEISIPVMEDNDFKMKRRKVKVTGGDPIAKTLEALMDTADERDSDSAIPAGTKLLNVDVKNGLAIVDLSSAFDKLDKKGDTTQSLAQQQIRAALAQFPEIKTMRVTVQGKTYEDGHSGPWDNVPVRGDGGTDEPGGGGH